MNTETIQELISAHNLFRTLAQLHQGKKSLTLRKMIVMRIVKPENRPPEARKGTRRRNSTPKHKLFLIFGD